MPVTYASLKLEFATTFDGGDPLGSTMAWWFPVATEMVRRGLEIPAEWQFRPGISAFMGPDPEDYAWATVAQARDEDLARFGRLLFRYGRRLKRAGFDY